MTVFVSALAGVLFGLGLAVSQMMDPAKVLNFLDLAGAWDPSLILVMGGALCVTVPGFFLVLKRPAPVLALKFELPDATNIDASLITGAALFGLGWGLAGFCPGPAIAALATGKPEIAAMVVAMLVGYRAMAVIEERKATAAD